MTTYRYTYNELKKITPNLAEKIPNEYKNNNYFFYILEDNKLYVVSKTEYNKLLPSKKDLKLIHGIPQIG